MQVLILTQNYAPEPDTKMHTLAKGLSERGHEVIVVTGFPNYPEGKIYSGYRQKPWQKEEFDGVQVVRLPLYPDRSSSVIKRSLNYLSFPFSASLVGPFLCRKVDLIFVYHPPITLGIPAIILSSIWRVPFIFEIQDMWPETLLATGMVDNPFILKLLGKLGMITYSKAAAITVISPGFKRNLETKGIPGEKIYVFYNWAYEGDFTTAEPDQKFSEQLGLKGHFNILYAGNMGPAQGLHNVIEAASLLTSITDLQFILIGSGIERSKLEAMVAERRLRNVLFLNRLPLEKMPLLYENVDVVMVHLTDDPLFGITIPGKTQSCLLSGKPVIASVNGDAAELIVMARAGLAVEAMNPGDLAQAVRNLYDMPPREREAMGEAGRDFYFKNLCPEVQIKKYERLFEKIASNRTR